MPLSFFVSVCSRPSHTCLSMVLSLKDGWPTLGLAKSITNVCALRTALCTMWTLEKHISTKESECHSTLFELDTTNAPFDGLATFGYGTLLRELVSKHWAVDMVTRHIVEAYQPRFCNVASPLRQPIMDCIAATANLCAQATWALSPGFQPVKSEHLAQSVVALSTCQVQLTQLMGTPPTHDLAMQLQLSLGNALPWGAVKSTRIVGQDGVRGCILTDTFMPTGGLVTLQSKVVDDIHHRVRAFFDLMEDANLTEDEIQSLERNSDLPQWVVEQCIN